MNKFKFLKNDMKYKALKFNLIRNKKKIKINVKFY